MAKILSLCTECATQSWRHCLEKLLNPFSVLMMITETTTTTTTTAKKSAENDALNRYL